MTRQEAIIEAKRRWPDRHIQTKIRGRSDTRSRYAVGLGSGRHTEWFYGPTWEGTFAYADMLARLAAENNTPAKG